MAENLRPYRQTIGRLASTRSAKLHIAHGLGQAQHVVCKPGRPGHFTVITVAELPIESNTDICDVLLGHGVRLCDLCSRCFSVKLRIRYAARLASQG